MEFRKLSSGKQQMTPYRGRRFSQGGGSQWEWEEQENEERLQHEREVNAAHRNCGDAFFEKRIGWLEWAVMERGGDGFIRVSIRGFWRWKDAVRAVNEARRIRNDALSESFQEGKRS